jgi:hypothetical protein
VAQSRVLLLLYCPFTILDLIFWIAAENLLLTFLLYIKPISIRNGPNRPVIINKPNHIPIAPQCKRKVRIPFLLLALLFLLAAQRHLNPRTLRKQLSTTIAISLSIFEQLLRFRKYLTSDSYSINGSQQLEPVTYICGGKTVKLLKLFNLSFFAFSQSHLF